MNKKLNNNILMKYDFLNKEWKIIKTGDYKFLVYYANQLYDKLYNYAKKLRIKNFYLKLRII